MPLSDRDRALLEFEARHPRHGAIKEEAVRTELDLAPARYYQLLGRLMDDPDALAFDPLLVHRLRRVRDARRQTLHRVHTEASPSPEVAQSIRR